MKSVAYIFDIWARMDSDDVAVLDTQVVANHTVHASASIIQIIICQYDQDGIFPLLALDKHCVPPEQL